jgi:hypothetical protein
MVSIIAWILSTETSFILTEVQLATHTGMSFQLIIDLELISNYSKHF